jgi:hypothetical protein
MTYLFIPQAGDREAIDTRLRALESATKEVLIATYNKYQKTGIVGVRAQIHGILALHQLASKTNLKWRYKLPLSQ